MISVLKNDSTDPFFNMAMEEYFLNTFSGYSILLWRNQNTVVVGRNQNTLEEIDPAYVQEHQISVVRRLTGGGAVFHDLGNINFTVIQPYQDGLFSDYAYFTKPICAFLHTLGIDAVLSGRNDLLIDGMKFSGNAQTKQNGRILHHGTILFDANNAHLAGALKPGKLKVESKSIKSVKSRVTNIRPHLKQSMTVDAFFEALYAHFLEHTPDTKAYVLTATDRAAIEKLRKERYATWQWNYGTSPAYTARSTQRFPFGIVDVLLTVQKGLIKEIKIYGDFFGMSEITLLENALRGVRHEEKALLDALQSVPLAEIICGMALEDLLTMLLS